MSGITSTGGALEGALRHDRTIVLGALAAVAGVAGLYTVSGFGMSMSAVDMTGMARAVGAPTRMAMSPEWAPGYAILVFLMCWVMMIAMMTPSAAPTLCFTLRCNGGQRGPRCCYSPGCSSLAICSSGQGSALPRPGCNGRFRPSPSFPRR